MNSKDILVIDIETKNTFFDVGGQANIKDLDMSLTCAYSYNEGSYLSFWEKDLKELEKRMKEAALIIGFSINRFDLPVLNKYFDFNANALKRLDLLEEIEMSAGKRIGLDLLAHTNLGIGKTHNGLEAVKFWNEGNLEELEAYCLNDVKVTKDLYELAKSQNYLMMPQRGSDELIRVNLDFNEKIREATTENTLF
ncbi:MAG: ribonuclease H-like domain-containing protein [Candidatus Colwellbacteria bacterium]|jgi:DEAD/DEAH box helicase domain-containing protein|nr:ribonuclease H-like domain-containing protein [Candidatus Colwellbacteria bacterium]MCK9497257.1 ribonuclease H-like domain-containing protein [Candidatus Colwellbacteria bacterium]MDD3752864.1 ribonuclease H-like domain-containing protein [Candidatus Colwellbacteria bacterium]